MAQQKLIDLDLLTRYDGKIKEYVGDEDAKQIPKVTSPTAGDFVTVTATGTLVDAGATIASSKISGLGTAAAANVATSAIVESSTDTGLVSAEQVAAFVASEISGITGAMHFVGVITRQTGETDAQAIARVVTSPEAGDVVVMSDNAKEYIYTDSTSGWREVGDETEFVKKTATIAGVDLQDNITKSELQTALNVADGAQVNVIETVQVNGTALTPSSKTVNVTVAEGSTNGTVAVNGSDVAVHGLGSAAYTASTAYDAAGTAAAAIEALDSSTSDSGVTATSGSVMNAITSLTLADGKVSAYGYTALGSAALSADTAFLKTADYTLATNSDIDALFPTA